MELQIAEEIVAQTDRCAKDHVCLTLEGDSCSTPETHFVGDQLFLCHGDEPCAYKAPFGSNFFCICPVRKAVFQQTGK